MRNGIILKTVTQRVCLILLFSALFFTLTPIEEREPFPVPLAHLFVRIDRRTGKFDEVFISFPGNDREGWGIAEFDDRYIKFTLRRQVDHIHREYPRLEYQLSPFEAERLNKVCNTFIRTLTIFERNLQRKNWGKLLYLDAYLPQFFNGLFYLVMAARCSSDSLPGFTRIPDSLYENNFTSPKSDKRIQAWRNNPEHVMKMRIVTKELIFQIKKWQKVELNNPKRKPYASRDHKFREVYGLFIKLYFNMKKR